MMMMMNTTNSPNDDDDDEHQFSVSEYRTGVSDWFRVSCGLQWSLLCFGLHRALYFSFKSQLNLNIKFWFKSMLGLTSVWDRVLSRVLDWSTGKRSALDLSIMPNSIVTLSFGLNLVLNPALIKKIGNMLDLIWNIKYCIFCVLILSYCANNKRALKNWQA